MSVLLQNKFDYGYDEDEDEDEIQSDTEEEYYYEDEEEPDNSAINNCEQTKTLSNKSIAQLISIPMDSYVDKNLNEIFPLMMTIINEVSALLNISEDEAQVILQNFKWDKEKLTDCYFSNPEKVHQECGLESYSASIMVQLHNKFLCRICYDETDISESFALGCGHRFCKCCFSEYLRSEISNGSSCVATKCPEHKCKQTVTKSVVHQLLHPQEAGRYDLYFLRDFIEKSKNMKYCPAPGCDKVAVGSGVTTICCPCSYVYCFKCGEEAHDPCSCRQLAVWREKCAGESETLKWILVNTKKCPKCFVRIEKNNGCNHMTCKLCRHEFCWLCMGAWIGHNSCNKFTAPEADSLTAKTELDRYLHYYQRYHGHDQSLRFAAEQRKNAKAKMAEEQLKSGFSTVEVQYLLRAVDQVINCRRVLKYTYAVGFLLPEGSAEKELLEYQQEMLERNVEKLHSYTEQPMSSVDSTQVENLCRISEKFLASLQSMEF